MCIKEEMSEHKVPIAVIEHNVPIPACQNIRPPQTRLDQRATNQYPPHPPPQTQLLRNMEEEEEEGEGLDVQRAKRGRSVTWILQRVC